MAVPFIYSPSTTIASSEMNTNLAYVDYTDIDNDKYIQFRNSTNVLDHYIYEDAAGNNLIFTLGSTSTGKAFIFRNETPSNIAYFSNLGLTIENGGYLLMHSYGNTYYSVFYHDGGSSIFQNTAGSMAFFPANGRVTVQTTGQQNVFIAYDTTVAKNIALYHNSSNGVISTDSGGIVCLPASGIFSIESPGVTNYLGAYDAGLTKHIYMYHNGTYAGLESSSGDLNFIAPGSIYITTGSTLVSVQGHIYPSVAYTYNLGSVALPFQDGHFNNYLYCGHIQTTLITSSSNIDVGAEIRPLTDNVISCGLAVRRWSDVRSVKFNGADIGFQNDWKLREYGATVEDVDTRSVEWFQKNTYKGISLLDDEENLIAVFGKNGVLYIDDVKKLEYAMQELN